MENEETKSRSTSPASLGGQRRKELLPAGRRAEIAKQAADARWSTSYPQAVAEGTIDFAGRRIACAVLNTKLRVLTQETFLTTMGRAAKAKGGTGSQRMTFVGGLPPFLAAANLEPFISDGLRQAATPVAFRTEKGNRAFGYDARLLPLVCEVYLTARDANLKALKEAQEQRRLGHDVEAKPVLMPSQEPIVERCDMLMRSMAKEHIVSLVDRATGYKEQENRDELLRILSEYIAPHLMPWTKKFPDEFFRQVYRLHGWTYQAGNTKHPRYLGIFINTYVYDVLPAGVLDKLRELNPVVTESGHRAGHHHRHLSGTGNIHLDRQITSTTTIMALSSDKDDFKVNFAKVHTVRLTDRQPKMLKITEQGDAKTDDLFSRLEGPTDSRSTRSA